MNYSIGHRRWTMWWDRETVFYFSNNRNIDQLQCNVVRQRYRRRYCFCSVLQSNVGIRELRWHSCLYRKWRALSLVFDVSWNCWWTDVSLPTWYSYRFTCFFSPPGMPARLAIYFPNVFFIYYIFFFHILVVRFRTNWSQELLNGSSPKFQGW